MISLPQVYKVIKYILMLGMVKKTKTKKPVKAAKKK